MKTIRIAAVALALTALPAGLLAQESGTSMQLGLKAGLNLATLNTDGDTPGRRTAFIGGAHLTVPLGSQFYIQPELLYSMKGMKIGFMGFTATWSLDYIEVPVLAMFKLPFWSSLEPFAYAGPAVGFNVRSNMGADYEDEEIGSVDLADYTNSVDFSLVIGAGIAFNVAGRQITLEGRYVPGLNNVYTDEFGEVSDVSIEQFNDTISILLGYAF